MRVLHRLGAAVLVFQADLVLDFVVNLAGDADAAGLAGAFQPRGDVDAGAVQIVAIDDDFAQVDAHPENHPGILGHMGVAPGHLPLDRHRAVDRVHGAGEFHQQAVAGGLENAAGVFGDGGVDQFLAVGPSWL